MSLLPDEEVRPQDNKVLRRGGISGATSMFRISYGFTNNIKIAILTTTLRYCVIFNLPN
jgi:hypothetical protein